MNLSALLLILLVSSAFSQIVNYVRPDDSSPEVCPDLPCLMLEQYNFSSFSTGASLMFLSGNHSLKSPLRIENIYDVTLKSESINDNVTIFFKIFYFNHVTSSSIENLNFSRLSLHFTSTDATLCNCTFQGDSKNNSIEIFDSVLKITNCHFREIAIFIQNSLAKVTLSLFESVGCRAVKASRSNVTIFQSRFVGLQEMNAYQGFSSGGVYFYYNSIIDIADCYFENNTAASGGAVAVRDSQITVSGTVFAKNHAKIGGAMYIRTSDLILCETLGVFNSIDDCYFENNSASYGGAVAVRDSQINASGTVFEKNYAKSGGAIIIYINTSDLILSEILGVFNSAIGYGGAIADCHFENNSASYGGAVAVRDSQINVSGTVFFKNYAAIKGGAIHIITSDMILSETLGVSFLCNSTEGYGGAIADCCFDNNSASYGGAAAVRDSQITVSGTVFEKNHAKLGGAVYTKTSDLILSETLRVCNSAKRYGGAIADCHFENNSASYGGAVAVRGSQINISGTVFVKNYAKYGGAIYINTRDLILSETLRVFNSAIGYGEAIADCHFENNSASYGGAVAVHDSQINISGTVFVKNYAAIKGGAIYVITIDMILSETLGVSFLCNSTEGYGGAIADSCFENNSASYGGAAAVSSSQITVSGTVFEKNYAKSGGVIYIYTSDLILSETLGVFNSAIGYEGAIADCHFENNSASYGGAVAVLYSQIKVSGTVFVKNYAKYGGAIYINTRDLILSETLRVFNSAIGYGEAIADCHFENNSASYGGAVAVRDSQINISGTVFVKNYAKIKGGAIYVITIDMILSETLGVSFLCNSTEGYGGAIADCHFENNSASYGGAVAVRDSQITVSGTVFEKNYAKLGGAIYINISDLTLSETLGVFNSAIVYGGAIADCHFENNSASYGGAVAVLYSQIKVSGTVFEKNHAKLGGAVYTKTSDLILSETSRVCNSAKRYGGAITDCCFENNSASYGGAVAVRDSQITVSGTVFEKNYAESGGAIIIYITTSDLILSETLGVFNTTTGYGGAIADCHFENNSASYGGAVAVLYSQINVSGTVFVKNYAEIQGGAIYVITIDMILIETLGVSFLCNSTEGYGGAIADCCFDNNSASYGGAAAVRDSQITVSGTIFEKIFAKSGGAIYINTSDLILSETLEVFNSAIGYGGAIADCHFENNSASHGGAVTVRGSQITVSGTAFVKNHAKVGGAVYIKTSDLILSETLRVCNSAKRYVGTIADCCFDNNSASYGGAVAVRDSQITVSGTVFVKNYAKYGGAIYINTRDLILSETLGVFNSAIGYGGAIADCHFENNSASYGGGAVAVHDSQINVSGTVFVKNYAAIKGGAIYIKTIDMILSETLGVSFLCNSTEGYGGAIADCYFENNSASYGGVVAVRDSQITVSGTVFVKNHAKSGGVMYIKTSDLSETLEDSFLCNLAEGYGGAIANCYFENNFASYGGVVSVFDSQITVSGTVFVKNYAVKKGGVMYIRSSDLILSEILRACNSAEVHGGAIVDCYIENNSASYGGAVTVRDSQITVSGTVFVKNHAKKGGAMYIETSTLILSETFEVSFFCNSADDYGGALYFRSSYLETESKSRYVLHQYNAQGQAESILTSNTYGSCLNNQRGNVSDWQVERGKIIFAGNTATKFGGGGIYFGSSSANISGTTFRKNQGFNGGAIRSFDSTTISFENTVFKHNKATEKGGAIFGVQSTISTGEGVIFEGNEALCGGALSVQKTKLIFDNTVIFSTNIAAQNGGAMEFSSLSTLVLQHHTNLTTSHNHASQHGGVIYHRDTPDITQCAFVKTTESGNTDVNSVEHLLPNCFIQLEDASNYSIRLSINSLNDSAGIAGNFLFGGLLDRCQMKVVLKQNNVLYPLVPFDFLASKVIHMTPDNSTVKGFSSQPYQLCICENNFELKCSEIKSVVSLRGHPFNVTVLALDQAHSNVSSNVTAVLSSSARLMLGQAEQEIRPHCTNLTYTLYSTEAEEQLVLYSDSPCPDSGVSTATIIVTILPCPDAFTQSRGQCICEERLQSYEVKCTINQEAYIERNADAGLWMSTLYDNGSYEGLILYNPCPLDYCTKYSINFTLDNLDAQCERNRGGLLCGACTVNYSLTFGGSKCQDCSSTYLFLLLPFAAAGIVLVVFLSFLRLTVATGMINSILLYANIVQANKATLFPSTSTNLLIVFIAWMNLDLGFQTCFYNGMNAYMQTWLQFAFPLYIWFLISLIILFSRYSITMSKLIGHNPIAVMATLLLMSYAKILKIIIEVYSPVNLEYPDNKTVTVWLKDANVPYLHAKHLTLTVTTTLVLVFFFIPYTLLVFLGHKLYQFSGRKYFSWLRRVKPLLDSYYAPYKAQTCYWPGFLLIIRCALYIVFSFNSLGGTNKSLLFIIATFTAVLSITWLFVQVYNSFSNNAIEASVYLNLIILSAASLAGVNVPELMFSLVGIVFMTMLGIIIYHFHILYIAKTPSWLKIWGKLKMCIQSARAKMATRRSVQLTASSDITFSHESHKMVTSSVVDIREPLLDRVHRTST